MPASERIDKDEIVQVFKLDVESPKRVKLQENRRGGKLYRVDLKDLNGEVYIIDTPEGREIACNPHVVGRQLEIRSSATAEFAVRAMKYLADFETPFLVLNILRAGPGYMISHAMEDFVEKSYQVYIRTKYVQSSYRDHVERNLKIVFEDLSNVPAKCGVNLLVPDTFATGASAEVAIKRIFDVLSCRGSHVEKIFLYGFISKDSVRYLLSSLHEYDVEFTVLALEDLMELASNNYDMAIYGLDLAYYERFRRIRKLSSVIPEDVLDECLPCYAPGSDQPGDFSSRQTRLFNGQKWEWGPIFSHLLNSLAFIRSLKRISFDQPWYSHDAIFKEKEDELGRACLRYLPNSLFCIRDSLSSIDSFLRSQMTVFT